jgi:MFS family permease
MGFQQLTGVYPPYSKLTQIDVILYFAPIVFSQAGFPSRQGSFLASGISGIINFIFTIPAQLYVDKVGRRKPLLAGSLIISIALLTLGSLYAKYGQPLPNGTTGLISGPPKYIAIISIYVIVAAFASTWAIVGKLYTAEIIPNRYRARACAIQQWVNWTTNFIVALTAPYFLSKSASGPYFMYGGFTFLTVIVLAKWMPETKGLGLERIAEIFGVAEEREMMTLATGRETPFEARESRRRAAMERRGSEA